MNWDALGALGEIVGAIATVATLLYLAVQIRQNSRTVRAANFLSIQSDNSSYSASITDSDEVADIYSRGLESFSGLGKNEKTRFHFILSNYFANYQVCFRLHQAGQLEDDLYQDTIFSGLQFVERKGVREWWATARTWYHPEFVALVQARIDEVVAQQGAAADSA